MRPTYTRGGVVALAIASCFIGLTVGFASGGGVLPSPYEWRAWIFVPVAVWALGITWYNVYKRPITKPRKTDARLENITDVQYQIIAARRLQYDNLLWQTPVISLTAQAFLFTIALDHDSHAAARIVASSLAFITALATAHLHSKHRGLEVYYARLLQDIEQANTNRGMKIIHNQPIFDGMVAWSAYSIWWSVFLLFAFASASAGVVAWLSP